MEDAERIAEVLALGRKWRRIRGRMKETDIAEPSEIAPRDFKRLLRSVDAVQCSDAWRDQLRPAAGAASHVEAFRRGRQRIPWENPEILPEDMLLLGIVERGLVEMRPFVAE